MKYTIRSFVVLRLMFQTFIFIFSSVIFPGSTSEGNIKEMLDTIKDRKKDIKDSGVSTTGKLYSSYKELKRLEKDIKDINIFLDEHKKYQSQNKNNDDTAFLQYINSLHSSNSEEKREFAANMTKTISQAVGYFPHVRRQQILTWDDNRNLTFDLDYQSKSDNHLFRRFIPAYIKEKFEEIEKISNKSRQLIDQLQENYSVNRQLKTLCQVSIATNIVLICIGTYLIYEHKKVAKK